MLMHAITHVGCKDTSKESPLEVDSGRKSLVAPGTRTRVNTAPGVQSDDLSIEPLPPFLEGCTKATFSKHCEYTGAVMMGGPLTAPVYSQCS